VADERTARERAVFESVDWETVTMKLVHYAFRRMGRSSWEDAREVAQTALEHMLDPAYARWDPAVQPDVFLHLGSVVNGLLANRWRKRREELVGDDTLAERAGGAEITPALAQRDGARLKGVLAARLAADPLGLAIVRLTFDEDLSTPREQAAALNEPLEAIKNARRRVSTHLDAVRRELGMS
jgi:hypothetical protein